MSAKYGLYWFRIVLITFVIVGALNWGLYSFGYNMVSFITRVIGIKSFEKIIYILIGLSSLLLMADRSLWLPFLGDSVLPSSLVPLKTHYGNTTVKVHVTPNTKVAYWAANPGNNPKIAVEYAYGDYDNSGVVKSDANGVAILRFNRGTSYVVPYGKQINSHVHYRELTDPMMGPIKSVFV